MPIVTENDTKERRWLPVFCQSCIADHGVTVGGLLAIVEASQNGDLITTSGNTLCILTAIEPNRRIGNYRVDGTPRYKG